MKADSQSARQSGGGSTSLGGDIGRCFRRIDDARLVYARQHGFTRWDEFGAHLEALARGEEEEPFKSAFEAIQAADAARLRELLEAGADPSLPNHRGWTPLHQAAYGNQVEVTALLVASGAPLRAMAYGEGGTPLVAALFWGHREVAEVLAAHEVVPTNLRVAAGLGRADLVRAAFHHDGSLRPEARAERGFYRCHTGFPLWQPSDERQEILDEALQERTV
jgi:hypothetical protein